MCQICAVQSTSEVLALLSNPLALSISAIYINAWPDVHGLPALKTAWVLPKRATSLSLYGLLLCLEAYQGPGEKGDWIFELVRLAFCATGIVAAKAMSGPMAANRTDAGSLNLGRLSLSTL